MKTCKNCDKYYYSEEQFHCRIFNRISSITGKKVYDHYTPTGAKDCTYYAKASFKKQHPVHFCRFYALIVVVFVLYLLSLLGE
jgi:hypothetical protein